MDGAQIASLLIAAGSLIVAFVAAGVAFWQGNISKQQLDLAKRSEDETKDALKEIRDLARDSDRTIAELKVNIDERVTKILDSKLENEQNSAAMSNQFGQMFIESMMKGLGGDEQGGASAERGKP